MDGQHFPRQRTTTISRNHEMLHPDQGRNAPFFAQPIPSRSGRVDDLH